MTTPTTSAVAPVATNGKSPRAPCYHRVQRVIERNGARTQVCAQCGRRMARIRKSDQRQSA